MFSSAFVFALVASAMAAPSIPPLQQSTRPVESFASSSNARSTLPTRRAIEPTTWDPPSNLVTPLKEAWDHEMSTYSDPTGFRNYGFDQIMATNGSINYCVRWDSDQVSTEADRATIASAIERSVGKWMEWLYGYDAFPFSSIPVTVVGWAVKDTSLLQGDSSGFNVYTDTDPEGIPQCAESCGRFFHQDNNYSGCAAGQEGHYDMSLWLTDGMGDAGAGGDWGQRTSTEYFLEAMHTENPHIIEHEIGHTFALDDFYDWTPTGVTNFIMLAGSATEVTDFDGWMLRNWWTDLIKGRYNL
ncbi:hypothetical protein CYLTODRAFT_489665 [Cylindrobasidium torrendii FP15055 ss-10]|uniref:Cellulose-binding family II protein n=1 Tax=Cylindrobasidium torrendii FP15055 ss-10 TaxID=1314674 RepID=A0A0D7BDC6_9AGAR|nr:hypothetical protein CYLTODRAFT_489665 [Cylindrobasidium torrendii FP15055 ss-10]